MKIILLKTSLSNYNPSLKDVSGLRRPTGGLDKEGGDDDTAVVELCRSMYSKKQTLNDKLQIRQNYK